MSELKLLFASNDWRSKQLADELKKKVKSFSYVEYDPIPFYYKYAAAALTFNRDKFVWWSKYQWHPLVQSGRRSRIVNHITKNKIEFDALLMWSSWMDPFLGTPYSEKPFYYYIDQSCNTVVDEFDTVDSPALEQPRKHFNRDQFKAYERCKAVFSMSSWTRSQTLQSHSINEKKVPKMGWGPIGMNLMDEKIGLSKEPTILFVGNEFLRKGVDVLREALPLIVRDVPSVRLKIVGSNVDNMILEPHPNLEILGKINDIEELKNLYREATVFVLPHRFERAGHVIIEAMTAGKPIVTSNQGGPIDVVRNFENGFIVDVGDSDLLAKRLITLLKNPEMCLKFGERAKEIVKEGYTWERIAQKMLDHIENTRT